MGIDKYLITLFMTCRLSFCVTSTYNYIVNGGFEQPAVTIGTYLLVATGWTGTNFNLWKNYPCGGFSGQCMDLRDNSYQNGYI